jgi:hypothetical protein
MTLDQDWNWQTLRGSREPLAGWYSAELGRKEPCWTLRGSRVTGSNASVKTGFGFESPAGNG